MLVSDEDFTIKKPENKNLIDQMKKKISQKEVKEKQRSRTLIPNTVSIHNSAEKINSGMPNNFHASKNDQNKPLSYRSGKLVDENGTDFQSSFISNKYNENRKSQSGEVKDLNKFNTDIKYKEKKKNSFEEFGESGKDSTSREDEKYNTNKLYDKRMKKGSKKPKNIILKEFNSYNMDDVDSLSSGLTTKSVDETKEDEEFISYLIGFLSGFFFSIFGLIIILFCSKSKKKCEGATHGMIVSGILVIIIFNGYFIATIQNIKNNKINSNKSDNDKNAIITNFKIDEQNFEDPFVYKRGEVLKPVNINESTQTEVHTENDNISTEFNQNTIDKILVR